MRHFTFLGILVLLGANAAAQLRPQVPAQVPRQGQKPIVLKPAQPSSGFQNWGFELGSLRGWSETGTAFDSQPTFENNVEVRRPGIELNHEGNYWVGTFENRPDAAAPLGRTQGDERTGILTSPDFTIERRYITFLIGGGRQRGRETLQVRLVVPDPATSETSTYRGARGRDREELERVVWDVADLKGKRARIEIVDEATGPWGHINADDFQFTDVAPTGARTAEEPDVVVSSGRFRVTINGFIAWQQTWDDALQRDGKDDEVFLITETRLVKRNGGIAEVATLPQKRSSVMGDLQGFDDRVKAGSASDLGGIRSGDRVPVDMPWARHRAVNARALPFLVWEGELTSNSAVMIVPTLWEWDGGETPFAFLLRALLDNTGFDSRYTGVQDPEPRRTGGASLLRRLSTTEVGRNVIGTNVFQEHSVAGVGGDRPIGMEFDNGQYRFDPWVLNLDYDRAMLVAGTDYGRGAGVIEVPYTDAVSLKGRYTLFLQVERLP